MDESSRGRSSTPLRVAEALLVVALAFAPLALGTVQWWSLAILVTLCLAAALCALAARRRPLPWPLLAAFGTALFVGLQAVPLPRAVYRFLSPHLAQVLDRALGDAGGSPAFHALSYDPAATLREFARLAAYAAAAFACSRIVSDRTAARRLAAAIGGLSLLQVAVIGFHKVINTQMIFGLVAITDAERPLLGTFGNSNHQAGYLTLGVPLLGVLAVRATRPLARRLWWIAAAIVSVTVVLTVSRSGIVGLLASWIAFLALVNPARASSEERGPERAPPTHAPRRAVVLFAVAAVLVLSSSAAFLVDGARSDKLRTLLHPARLLEDQKIRAWRDIPSLVADHPFAGVGRGAFEQVFPAYREHSDRLTYTHAESAPLQLLSDLGVLFGLAVASLWVAGLYYAARREGQLLRRAAVASLIGITVHELGDFGLEASGGVGVTAAVLWGLCLPAASASRHHAAGERSRARPGPLVALPRVLLGLAGAGVVAAALYRGYAGDLDRDIAALRALEVEAHDAASPALADLARAAIRRHPVEPWFHLMAGVDRLRAREPAPALRDLGRSLSLDPTGFAAHHATAEALWQLGLHSQALLEYRLAYVYSDYLGSVARGLADHADFDVAAQLDDFTGGDLDLLTRFATFLEQIGRFPEAAIAARRLLESAPNDPFAHRLLARAAARAGRYQEVLDETALVETRDPDTALLRAQALDRLERADEADQFLIEAYDQRPTPDGALNIAERHLARDRPDAALALLRTLSDSRLLDQQEARFHQLRSRYFQLKLQVQPAITEMAAAARAWPAGPYALELAEYYEKLGMLRDAIATWRGLARSRPASAAEFERRIARIDAILRHGTSVSGGSLDRSPQLLEEFLPAKDDTAAGNARTGEPGSIFDDLPGAGTLEESGATGGDDDTR